MSVLSLRKTGVLTLQGYAIRVSVSQGHLVLEDGIGPERRTLRLSRIARGLKRLIIIGSDGFVSLTAIRWSAAQTAAFISLGRDGDIITVTRPEHAAVDRLRLAVVLSLY